MFGDFFSGGPTTARIKIYGIKIMSPTTRASLAASFFTLLGIISFFFGGIWRSDVGLPLAIFYFLLVANTFFSIRFFSSLITLDTGQHIIDAILLVFYVLIALSMDNGVAFFFSATCLFLIASLKYVLLLKHATHAKILWRKIRINLIGAAACTLTLGGILLGHPLASVWAMAIAFGVANVYLLLIKPMYHS